MCHVMETVALVMPAWPCLYTSSCRFVARTCAATAARPAASQRSPPRSCPPVCLRVRRPHRTHLRQVLDAQHEADGVQDVGLAAAIEPGDGVEGLVKIRELHALRVGLEALDRDFRYVHGGEAAPAVRRRELGFRPPSGRQPWSSLRCQCPRGFIVGGSGRGRASTAWAVGPQRANMKKRLAARNVRLG